jgi:hypothetical protein
MTLVGIAVVSVPYMAGAPQSSARLEHSLTGPQITAWGALCLIGSVTALLGIILQKWTRTGYVLERTGMIFVGGTFLIYASVLWTQAAVQNDVRYTVGVQTGLGLACAWRAWHITKRLRWARNIRAERD